MPSTIAAASYSARSLRLIRGNQLMRSMPGWCSNNRPLKVSNSLRVISSLAEFEQGAQCHEPADIFVHAVLHDDGLGLGTVLELDLVDAVLPSRNRGRARQREQQADANRDQRRAIQPERRRGVPPSAYSLPILIILIVIAHP